MGSARVILTNISQDKKLFKLAREKPLGNSVLHIFEREGTLIITLCQKAAPPLNQVNDKESISDIIEKESIM